MTEKDSVFLSYRETRDALCFDFRQYELQLLLFCELIRLISDGKTVFRRDGEKKGVWISEPGRQKMRWLEGSELIDYMCHAVSRKDLDPEILASICSRVFRTRAVPAEASETGEPGIRVDTGMESFHCRQCGQCCRNLEYRDGATEEDVARWKKMGRKDILNRVGMFETRGGKTTYRIWMETGKLEPADTCPFLEKVPTENRWCCRIHDVKPTLCRQYPVSRKHAKMTGCPGFDD